MKELDEETDESMESVEGLVKGREKRITAGNRLQALLDQEFEAEGIFDVGDDCDGDFDSDQHPLQDIEISESDDEDNTSSEGHEEHIKKKPPEAFYKHRIPKEPRIKKSKPKTFTIVHPDSVRHSSRAYAIENKNIIDQRLKEAQKKKERHSPFIKIKERPMTQEERIAEAKITEEKNKTLLQRLIRMEEEKKENIRNLLKTNKTMTGPFIRFWSRGTEQGLDGKWIFLEPKNTSVKEERVYGIKLSEKDAKNTPESMNDPKNSLLDTSKEFIKNLQDTTKNSPHSSQEEQETLNEERKMTETALEEPTSDMFTCFHTDDKQSDEFTDKKLNEANKIPFQGPSMFSARNYIILEGFSEPFGVNEQKNVLFSCVDPPAEQKKHLCFITGNIAKYKDPVSGLYYSNLSAYKIIHQIIHGDISWSRLAGTFVGVLKPAHGVPLDFYDTALSSDK
ncbi:unnamed protein product [Pneumocystis jirovecii]|uniref:Vps72/YL1 C-terminal domain-containing protein n=1 Tax=Pneumocystis jirovecii TaxID=42068 RepID=L0PEL9_PNEJI|nr:unnamed protein product [Pneumocystis jirovecii]